MSIDDLLIARLRNYMESISSGKGKLITFDDHVAAIFITDYPGGNPVGCLYVYEKIKTIIAVAEFAFTAIADINIAKTQSMIPAKHRVKVFKGATDNRILAKKKIIIKDRDQLEQRLDELLGVVVKVANDIASEFNNEDMDCIKSQGINPKYPANR